MSVQLQAEIIMCGFIVMVILAIPFWLISLGSLSVPDTAVILCFVELMMPVQLSAVHSLVRVLSLAHTHVPASPTHWRTCPPTGHHSVIRHIPCTDRPRTAGMVVVGLIRCTRFV